MGENAALQDALLAIRELIRSIDDGVLTILNRNAGFPMTPSMLEALSYCLTLVADAAQSTLSDSQNSLTSAE